jgi:phosphopantetheine adenylyltransferase / dephospho-CoA kinase
MIADIHRTKKCQVIILEAAILLQAGWQKDCHEVWSCIIPADEAVKRIISRNGLSEVEANQRIASQMDNSTIVANSNIVFSSLWSYDYSQEQAERAWSMLTKELKEKWMRSTKL